jgi:diguanylate cyclase (GGDEF)-like protein
VSIAVIAAAAAAGFVLVVALATTRDRRRRRSGGPVARALAQLNHRLDTVSGELIDRSSPGNAHRAAGPGVDLGATPDLPELAERTLAAACGVAGVDAATIELVSDSGETVVDAVGIVADPPGLHRLNGPPDGRRVAAVRVAYTYAADDEPPGCLRSGLAVTLASEVDDLGVLSVYSFDPEVPPDAVRAIDRLARSIVPALEAARRQQEPPRLANRSLHERLAWEIASARRTRRSLTLLLLAVDGATVGERLGLLAGDDPGSAAAAWIHDVARRSDTSFRLGAEELAVVLPDATASDAQRLHERVARLLAGAPTRRDAFVPAGIAALEPDDDAMSLFQRADAALAEARARQGLPHGTKARSG